MRKSLVTGLILIPLLGLVCGCGDGANGVEGAVTYDGQAVTAGAISFISPDAKSGGSGGGAIVDGKYTVPAGLKPGTYRVEIRWAKPTGKKFKSDSGEMLDNTEEGLPDKYHTKSQLTAEVKSGPNKIDFHLAK